MEGATSVAKGAPSAYITSHDMNFDGVGGTEIRRRGERGGGWRFRPGFARIPRFALRRQQKSFDWAGEEVKDAKCRNVPS